MLTAKLPQHLVCRRPTPCPLKLAGDCRHPQPPHARLSARESAAQRAKPWQSHSKPESVQAPRARPARAGTRRESETAGHLGPRGGERGRAGGRVHLEALHRAQRGRLVALQLLHGDHAVLQRGHLAATGAPV